MTKEEILAEIRRTAAQNGGRPLGRERFLAATGISSTDVEGKYWVRWSEAVREAGLTPNSLNSALAREEILLRLVELVRELQHFPVAGELRMKGRADPTFPNFKTFNRLGAKAERIAAVAEYARTLGYEDVYNICLSAGTAIPATDQPEEEPGQESTSAGYVYLLRHGSAREFKIGRTNNPIRREGEIGIELPQQIQPIHVITTDDPSGVEAYWHRRFAQKRLKNEWFALSASDVRAFKRWKKIH